MSRQASAQLRECARRTGLVLAACMRAPHHGAATERACGLTGCRPLLVCPLLGGALAARAAHHDQVVQQQHHADKAQHQAADCGCSGGQGAGA